MKKDKFRRTGKGRRCCLGGRIYSIPCCASYFAKDDFEEKDEFILFFQIILVQFILLFKIVLGKTASVARNLIILPPKQKRRPLPFLLSSPLFYSKYPYTVEGKAAFRCNPVALSLSWAPKVKPRIWEFGMAHICQVSFCNCWQRSPVVWHCFFITCTIVHCTVIRIFLKVLWG